MKQLLILCVAAGFWSFGLQTVSASDNPPSVPACPPLSICSQWFTNFPGSLDVVPVEVTSNRIMVKAVIPVTDRWALLGRCGICGLAVQREPWMAPANFDEWNWAIEGNAGHIQGFGDAEETCQAIIPQDFLYGRVIFVSTLRLPLVDSEGRAVNIYGIGVFPFDRRQHDFKAGHWRFNGTLTGEDGQEASISNNVQIVTDWNYGALEIGGSDSVVGYSAVQADGSPNIVEDKGSIRFWYKPNWTTGTGPGAMAILFEIQNSLGTPQACLSINQTGDTITLTAGGNTLFSYSDLYLVANIWYQIVVTHARGESLVSIHVNGVRLNGIPQGYMPDIDPAQFTLGNGFDGANPASGRFDELEVFNHVLTDIAGDYASACALDSDGDDIPNLGEIWPIADLDPYNPDFDGDGCLDGHDAVPDDPNIWDPIHGNDSGLPNIQLLEPISAIPQN